MLKLNGKVALVTGSTQGIGLAIAEGLAAEGVHIALTGLGDPQQIMAVVEDITDRHGVNCLHYPGDLTELSVLESIIDKISRDFGGVDILVNNAGMQHIAPIESFVPQQWDKLIALNLSTAFHLTRLAVPIMRQRGWGCIINMASAHGLVASPLKSAYVASKHGLIGLTKTIALEVANDNITCNAVCPGYVLTELVKRQIPEIAAARQITEQQVIDDVMLCAHARKQFVQVEEVAAAVMYLCSHQAASVTGIAMPVDCGWTVY